MLANPQNASCLHIILVLCILKSRKKNGVGLASLDRNKNDNGNAKGENEARDEEKGEKNWKRRKKEMECRVCN